MGRNEAENGTSKRNWDKGDPVVHLIKQSGQRHSLILGLVFFFMVTLASSSTFHKREFLLRSQFLVYRVYYFVSFKILNNHSFIIIYYFDMIWKFLENLKIPELDYSY